MSITVSAEIVGKLYDFGGEVDGFRVHDDVLIYDSNPDDYGDMWCLALEHIETGKLYGVDHYLTRQKYGDDWRPWDEESELKLSEVEPYEVIIKQYREVSE